MFKKKQIAVVVAHACAAATLLSAVPAFAQEQNQRVEITGSSIKRIAAEGSLPVQTLTKSDIEKTGANSVAELMQELPAIQGFTTTNESVGGGGGGFAGASIHGIGETRTLVLLNGKRIATWAGQGLTGYGAGFNMNALPVSMIDRVEILTDGASAIYGADAVAGVVNFITAQNLQGGTASATYTEPKDGKGKQKNASISAGFGDINTDGWNVFGGASYEKVDAIKATDRSYAKTGKIGFHQSGQAYTFINDSIRGVPANFEIYDTNNVRGAPTPVPGEYDFLGNPALAGTTCPAQHFYTDLGGPVAGGGNGAYCRFDYTSTIDLQPETEQKSAYISGSKQIGEHTITADVLYSKSTVTWNIAPPPIDGVFNQADGPAALWNKYGFGGPNQLDPNMLATDDVYWYWRGMDLGRRSVEDITDTWHYTLNSKGVIGAWEYDAALIHSYSKYEENYLNGWAMQNELNAALSAGSFDPFLPAGQQDAAGQQALAGMKYIGTIRDGKSTMDNVLLRGSTEAFKIGDRVAMFGTGVEWRKENVKYNPSLLAQSAGNNIAGDSTAESPYDVDRKTWGAFGELVVPLLKNLEVSAAVRYDDYDDFGNTTNYKLAGRYTPIKELLFRGSLGTGFKAPSVPQVAAGLSNAGVTANNYNCPTAALTYLQATQPTAVCRPAGSQMDVMVSGNTDLKAEESKQWSFGTRYEPNSIFTIGIDYWNVQIEQAIGQLDEAAVMANPAAYLDNFTTKVDPGTLNNYVSLYLPNENLGWDKWEGVDVDSRIQFSTDLGRVTTQLNWTHILKHKYQRESGGAYVSDLGTFLDGGVTIRNIARLAVSLDSGPWSHTVAYNYKSGYGDVGCDAADCGVTDVNGNDVAIKRSVDSYETMDLQTRYKWNKQLTVILGVKNVLDEDPPFTIKTTGGQQLGYDGRYADHFGRTMYGTLTYKFF